MEHINQDYKDKEFFYFLDEENYLYKDVIYKNRPYCAVEKDERWFVMPINFKFEAKEPYLCPSEAFETTKSEVDRLPVFDMNCKNDFLKSYCELGPNGYVEKWDFNE